MPLPRVRFTVRRQMVAVAVAASFFALARLRSLTQIYHERCEGHYIAQLHSEASGDARSAAYHASMLRKYQRAADRPWLSVGPDPPEPE